MVRLHALVFLFTICQWLVRKQFLYFAFSLYFDRNHWIAESFLFHPPLVKSTSIKLHWEWRSTPSTVVIYVESRDISFSRVFTDSVTDCTFGSLHPETSYKVLVHVLFNNKSNPTVPERAFVVYNGLLTTRRLGESDGDCFPNMLAVYGRD